MSFINKNSASSADSVLQEKSAQPYWNPYIAGIGLGLTLLAAFVLMGRGLGASGGLTSIVSVAVDTVAPEHAQSNGMYAWKLKDAIHWPTGWCWKF